MCINSASEEPSAFPHFLLCKSILKLYFTRFHVDVVVVLIVVLICCAAIGLLILLILML